MLAAFGIRREKIIALGHNYTGLYLRFCAGTSITINQAPEAVMDCIVTCINKHDGFFESKEARSGR